MTDLTREGLVELARQKEKEADRLGWLLSDPPKMRPEAIKLRAEAAALKARARAMEAGRG